MIRRWVLMYHRVCPRGPDTTCWFARGTAVTPEVFEAQLDWLLARFDVVPLGALSAPPTDRGRPRVSLTFDDGYAEILRTVLPVCQRRGVSATCFVSAGPLDLGEPLWFDVWYQAVQRGCSIPLFLDELRRRGSELPDDLDGFVTGAPRRWLENLDASERLRRLRVLSTLAGSAVTPDLYLSFEELRELRSCGWEIGGHGLRHERLSEQATHVRDEEIAASTALLDRLGVSGLRAFAYPHGAYDADVVRRIERAGFALACTVERGSWTKDICPLTIPRLFCRGDGAVPHRLLDEALA